MAVFGAILLLFGGLLGFASSWNAARPLVDPTRRYSPSWLPAMLTTELAPFWLLVHVAALAAGLGLGGWSNWGGRIGAGLIGASMILLLWIVLRSRLAVRQLRRLVGGRVPSVEGWAKLTGRPVPAPPGVREERRVRWRDDLTLDLTRPDDERRTLPVLVYVHGGGWTGGDPQRQGRDMYHALAADGWVTLAIRYPFTPTVRVEDQIDVVRAAVRWARDGLLDHGIEASHLALAGGSAGAHLASMAALTARTPDEQVEACVGMYGIYDMANRNGTRAHWAMIERRVMLESVGAAPGRYEALSPIDRIDGTSPPFLVVHGTRDTLVPIAEAEQFVATLAAARRPVDLVAVRDAQHAFDAVSSPTSRAVAAVVRDWLRSSVLQGNRGCRHSD